MSKLHPKVRRKPSALTDQPRRRDLSDRECASILGGLIGSLTQNADIATVRKAVRWWSETDEAWRMFSQVREEGLSLSDFIESVGIKS